MGKLSEVGLLVRDHLAGIDEVGWAPSLSDGRAHAASPYTIPHSGPQVSKGSLQWTFCDGSIKVRQLLGTRTLESCNTPRVSFTRYEGLCCEHGEPVVPWVSLCTLVSSWHFGEHPVRGSWKLWQELIRKVKLQPKETQKELSSESPSVVLLGPGFLTLLVTVVI